MSTTEIDTKIAELREELQNVKGNEISVYQRITGYYRPVQNWNKGKASEYEQRKPFNPSPVERIKEIEYAI